MFKSYFYNIFSLFPGEEQKRVYQDTFYLKAVSEVAVGVWKVRLQLQRGSVRLYRFRYVPAVFVHGGKVTVSVCESRVDLDRSRITLDGALHILHLLQRVAHVGVGVGECRANSDRFLIMHESFLQLALLL